MTAIDDFLAKLAASGPSSLAGALPQAFAISASGPYPLAKHVDIPGSAVGGELLLAFDALSVAPVAVAEVVPEAARNRVAVVLKPAELTGRYQLFGLETPRVELDTGGLMAPLATMAAAPGDAPTITVEQYDQLQQANDQRSKLNQTSNGRALVGTYNTHNDVYNEVFNTNAQLRRVWADGGATKEMSDYTSDALKTNAVVNPTADLRTFGTKKLSYNQNAFAQKLNVWAACLDVDEAAAEAALDFGDQVTKTTKNTQKLTVPMTGDQVYSTVNTAPPPPAGRLMGAAPAVQPLGQALRRVVDESHDANDLDLIGSHGFEMDDETQARLRAIRAETKRIKDPKPRVAVQDGDFSVALPESRFVYEITEQPDGALTVRLVRSNLALGAMDLGGAAWPGAAGQVARDRLAGNRFIPGILEDRIATQLTRVIRALAS